MSVYRRPDSPFYWFAFKLPDGRRIIESTGTIDKKLALQIYYAKRGDYLRVHHKFEHPKIKLCDFINDYLELYAKHSKISYRDTVGKCQRLTSFFGNALLHEITPDRLEKYRLHRLGQGVSRATTNRELSVLRHCFSKAIEWNKCDRNPVKMIKFYSEKENSRTKYLLDHQKVALLNACPPHTRRLVYFALNSGMRQGEILNLKWSDVDFTTHLISIRHSKSGKPRFVPMNSDLVQMLKGMPSVSDYVFGYAGGKLKWSHYRKSFESAVTKAELTDFRFHDARHTYASELIMKGVDLKTVSELLGHTSTIMTERYSHLSPEHKLAAVEKLSRGLMHLTDAPTTVDTILNDVGNNEKVEHRQI